MKELYYLFHNDMVNFRMYLHSNVIVLYLIYQGELNFVFCCPKIAKKSLLITMFLSSLPASLICLDHFEQKKCCIQSNLFFYGHRPA